MRLLTDSTGAVTDRYDYDPFGNILSHAGNTPNLYLYAGEQNDRSSLSTLRWTRMTTLRIGRPSLDCATVYLIVRLALKSQA